MFIIRWFSLVLMVIALMLLGADVVNTLEKHGELVMRSLEQILMLFAIDSKLWVQTNLPPQLANVCILIIGWPSWLTFGVLGVILALIAPATKKAVKAPPTPPISR
jgi:hypothetical protein